MSILVSSAEFSLDWKLSWPFLASPSSCIPRGGPATHPWGRYSLLLHARPSGGHSSCLSLGSLLGRDEELMAIFNLALHTQHCVSLFYSFCTFCNVPDSVPWAFLQDCGNNSLFLPSLLPRFLCPRVASLISILFPLFRVAGVFLPPLFPCLLQIPLFVGRIIPISMQNDTGTVCYSNI